MRRLLASMATALYLFASSANAEPIKIGWIGPLTGPAALLGVDALKAVRLAVAEVNRSRPADSRIEIVVEDDQYATAMTIDGYNRLVHDAGLKVILAYSYSGLFAIAPRAKKDGVLLIDPLDCDDDIIALPENVICIAKRTEGLGEEVARYFVKNHSSRIGIFHFESDAFPVKLAEGMKRELKLAGRPPVLVEGYASGTNDFKSLIVKAKGAALTALAVFGYDETATFIRQARDLGFTGEIATTTIILGPDTRKVAGDAANGVIVTNWLAQRGEPFTHFLNLFQQTEGRAPAIEVSTVTSYDTVKIIGDALRAAPTTVSQSQLAVLLSEHLYQLRDYPGAAGTLTMGGDGGIDPLPLILQRVTPNGIIQLVRDADPR